MQKTILKGIDNMKRIIMFITILVITLVSQNVYAANYNIKESHIETPSYK